MCDSSATNGQVWRKTSADDLSPYVDVPLLDVDDTMVQGELFPDLSEPGPDRGYRGASASKAAGITYRQLDYWARKHIVEPSITPSHGSGSRRLYSFCDIVSLAVAKKLLDLGVSLHNVTKAVEFLAPYGEEALKHVTILCDGDTVQECGDNTALADFLAAGSAVFVVSVGALWNQVDHVLAGERAIKLKQHSRTLLSQTIPVENIMAAHATGSNVRLHPALLHGTVEERSYDDVPLDIFDIAQ